MASLRNIFDIVSGLSVRLETTSGLSPLGPVASSGNGFEDDLASNFHINSPICPTGARYIREDEFWGVIFRCWPLLKGSSQRQEISLSSKGMQRIDIQVHTPKISAEHFSGSIVMSCSFVTLLKILRMQYSLKSLAER
jgi:hypothetical protein